MSSENLAMTAAVLLVAILPSILWKKFRTVLYETLRHPFRKTEIRFDEKGKVLEVKVSDNLGFMDSPSTEKHAPGRG
jgi:hypothetical protein